MKELPLFLHTPILFCPWNLLPRRQSFSVHAIVAGLLAISVIFQLNINMSLGTMLCLVKWTRSTLVSILQFIGKKSVNMYVLFVLLRGQCEVAGGAVCLPQPKVYHRVTANPGFRISRTASSERAHKEKKPTSAEQVQIRNTTPVD